MSIRKSDSGGHGESTCGGSGGAWRKRKYQSGSAITVTPHWMYG